MKFGTTQDEGFLVSTNGRISRDSRRLKAKGWVSDISPMPATEKTRKVQKSGSWLFALGTPPKCNFQARIAQISKNQSIRTLHLAPVAARYVRLRIKLCKAFLAPSDAIFATKFLLFQSAEVQGQLWSLYLHAMIAPTARGSSTLG